MAATVIVIFGASGDLAWRKLVPAYYSLIGKERLTTDITIVGIGHHEFSDEEFRTRMQDGIERFATFEFDKELWAEFSQRLHYLKMDVTEEKLYPELDDFLRKTVSGAQDRVYYMSISPALFIPIISNLCAHGMMTEEEGYRRVVIEKPFGNDYESAAALNRHIHSIMNEWQVYRIDHYLGKETAQNILFFRFANTIFEPLWNRNYISSVEITVAESVDVGHRGQYYDRYGVLRDMVQNHLLQLMAMVAMEPPAILEANALRNENVKLLKSVNPIRLEDTVRGQYIGYRNAEGIVKRSQTPTFIALKLGIDNWRWQGVPFYIRSGKALCQKISQIVLHFRRPPLQLFELQESEHIADNILSFRIQPDEGIQLAFQAKMPDSRQGRIVEMTFDYDKSFHGHPIPEAYERLLLDIILGDASLFSRSDSIEESWRLVDPVQKAWDANEGPPLTFYETDSWGPTEADRLLARDGYSWYPLGEADTNFATEPDEREEATP